ncbi:MAG: PSD1 and planctomycete cytochrome C domain-containing protein [Chthonomonadales bacterium]
MNSSFRNHFLALSFASIAPVGLLAIAASVGTAQSAKPATPTVNFQRDVRPVLSNICSACHGPDAKERKANLRLDTEEGARRTIVAHFPEKSSLYTRMKQTGPGQMPPVTFARRPTAKQIELIGQWIKEGAKWEQHWAYAPLHKPTPPVVSGTWAKTPVDRFILARLAPAKLHPSPETDRRTLIRRLSFDLTGLPPTFEEVLNFVRDRSPYAYEKVVDRLLASPHFGERLAVYWLDLVRYADTRGYHGDQNQEISPYRDYVINAFNSNMPFDQFTREQLAGDLLPTPTQDQRIASGYNKLLMTTEEGGSQAKEYMAKYAADRVRNVSAVWMGSTMGCCQCHDHKYDPFSTVDFYSMAAFFADVKQTAVGGLDVTSFPTAEESAVITKLSAGIGVVTTKLNTQTPELDVAQIAWEKTAGPTLKKPDAIAAIFAIEESKRSAKQKSDLSAYFRTIAPSLADARAERARLQADLDAVNRSVRKSMVTTAVAPAEMRVLARGNWLDDSGEVVSPAVPAFLEQVTTKAPRANRLDLANWLTTSRNPLTSRVMVNRLWALLFGHGICRSVEDFGEQGVPPSIPELLDWLAADYVEHGWDTKRIVREIVLSATYRQSSVPSAENMRLDPGNDYFARQGRKRLDAEFVRDNALTVCGLLDNRVGGTSAKPYQPPHYWDYLNFPMRTWQADGGTDQYRRGLYTYWCRTYLQPSLLAFDAPTREECTSARVASNTPQQALVLLNDPTYVEAARTLAESVLRERKTDASGILQSMFHKALQRDPSADEMKKLLVLYKKHRLDYQNDAASADALLKIGEHRSDPKLDKSELAAWTSVARIILNLHESITRN